MYQQMWEQTVQLHALKENKPLTTSAQDLYRYYVLGEIDDDCRSFCESAVQVALKLNVNLSTATKEDLERDALIVFKKMGAN